VLPPTSGAYVNGQTVVLLLFDRVSDLCSEFCFLYARPYFSQWVKEGKLLKIKRVAKKDRPVKPERNALYPTKTQIALRLLQEFRDAHGETKVTSVLADALYGEDAFMGAASKLFGNTQVISQLRENQTIEYKGKKRTLKHYFNGINKGVEVVLRVRGGKDVKATVSSARLKVAAHGKKRFVVALKYEGESDYRVW
jgi:hypothetical protein